MQSHLTALLLCHWKSFITNNQRFLTKYVTLVQASLLLNNNHFQTSTTLVMSGEMLSDDA